MPSMTPEMKAARAAKAAEKKIDKVIEAAYRARCCNIEIDLFDIPKVFKVGRAALAEGKDVGDEIAAYVETIRKN